MANYINQDDLEKCNVVILRWMAQQDLLDTNMNGVDYKVTGVSGTNGKRISPFNCMISELSEGLDSTDFKHWKAGTLDMDNLQLELVDMTHFIPMGMNLLNSPVGILSIDNILDATMDGCNYDDDIPLEEKYERFSMITTKILCYACDKIYNTSLRMRYYRAAMVNVILFYSKVYNTTIKGAIEELWDLYVIKNALNLHRKNNGYVEGTYVKIWDGVEDNEAVRALDLQGKSVDEAVVIIQVAYDTMLASMPTPEEDPEEIPETKEGLEYEYDASMS